MATRSRIGIKLKDGSVLSSYHHWDGYPQWLCRILNTHYNSRQQAADLIDGGDMSSAWGDENRAEYYSERGEDCPPRLDPSIGAYCDKEMGEEFHYVYKPIDGDYFWFCIDQHQWDGTDKQPEVVEIPA